MRKISAVLIILFSWIGAKAQNPVIITQPYKFQKWALVKDSLLTDQVIPDGDSTHKVPSTAWVLKNTSRGSFIRNSTTLQPGAKFHIQYGILDSTLFIGATTKPGFDPNDRLIVFPNGTFIRGYAAGGIHDLALLNNVFNTTADTNSFKYATTGPGAMYELTTHGRHNFIIFNGGSAGTKATPKYAQIIDSAGNVFFPMANGASTADSAYVKLPNGSLGLAPYGGGGGGSNLGNSDLTQTDPTRTFTIGTGSLTFKAQSGTDSLNFNTTANSSNIVHTNTSTGDVDFMGAGSGTANIESDDASGNFSAFTTNSGNGTVAFMSATKNGGDKKQIKMTVDTAALGHPGIEITDDIDNIGLTSPVLFPVSGDPNQYVQFGNVATAGSGVFMPLSPTADVEMDQGEHNLLISAVNGTKVASINNSTASGFVADVSDSAGPTEGQINVQDNEVYTQLNSGTALGIFALGLDGANPFFEFKVNGSSTDQGVVSANSDHGAGIGMTVYDTKDHIGYIAGDGIDTANMTLNGKVYTTSEWVKGWVAAHGGGASGITALTGDVTASGTGSVAATLATVNANVGSFGDATHVPAITVNAKGLTTAVTSTTITFPVTASNSVAFTNKSGNISQWTNDSGYGTGTLTSVTGTANRITSTGGTTPAIDISASYVGQSSITTVGTLSAGSIPYSLLTGTPTALPPSGTAGGELAGTYPNPTLLNSAVIGKVLTGYTSGSGTVASTDNILQAIQKLNGNDGLKVPTSTTVAGFALSSNVSLAALTATDATLTFSGSYDGSTARTVGLNLANANTWTAAQTVNKTALGTTTVNALISQNTTAAALGAQQITPSLLFSSSGWSTTNSASRDVSFRMYSLPVQGGANPTGLLHIQSSVNGGAFADVFTLDNSGNLIVPNGITAAGSIVGGNLFGVQGVFSTGVRGNSGGSFSIGTNGMAFSAAGNAIVVNPGTYTGSSGQYNSFSITQTYNETSTASDRDFLINRTETGLGSGAHQFMSLQVAGSEKFAISNTNLFSFAGTPGTAGQMPIVNAAGTAMTWVTAYTGLITGTPTIVAGTGAGTSPTVSVTTNGKQLQVTVTTGTLPTGTNATIATVTLPNALSYTPLPVFSSASAATALLNGASMIYMTSTGTANVTITSGTTALTAATTYVWNIAL